MCLYFQTKSKRIVNANKKRFRWLRSRESESLILWKMVLGRFPSLVSFWNIRSLQHSLGRKDETSVDISTRVFEWDLGLPMFSNNSTKSARSSWVGMSNFSVFTPQRECGLNWWLIWTKNNYTVFRLFSLLASSESRSSSMSSKMRDFRSSTGTQRGSTLRRMSSYSWA